MKEYFGYYPFAHFFFFHKYLPSFGFSFYTHTSIHPCPSNFSPVLYDL